MDPLAVLVLALGLAMDSFTVSICSGMTMNPVRLRHALRIAIFFGGFQALMPVAGWLGGTTVSHLIARVDHWIAFGLLALVGARMIREGCQGASCDTRIDPTSLVMLTTLAVATSIDALAVGLSFAVLKAAITGPVIVIGTVTAALSLAGVYLGRRYGGALGNRPGIAGGIVLLGIGARILWEHLDVATLLALAR